MSTTLLYAVCKSLVLPPGPQVVAGLAGLLCLLRWRLLGVSLLLFSVLSLWALSTPWLSAELAQRIEHHAPLAVTSLAARAPEAIVVLGGGSYRSAREYGRFDEISRLTLERLRYAARLQRASGLDLAVSGGTPVNVSLSEGQMMATTLEADFRVPVRWQETASLNTAENARLSAAAFDFRRIVLVTHAVHMPRAERAFVDAGFSVIPAPLGYFSGEAGPLSVTDFVPDMKSLWQSHYVLYELIGALWYRWAYA